MTLCHKYLADATFYCVNLFIIIGYYLINHFSLSAGLTIAVLVNLNLAI